jgi:hypothetical protein
MQTRHLAGIGVLLFIFSSCARNNDSSNQDINQVVVTDSWRVTLFTDSGNNETADFSGYSFEFLQNGTINATKGGVMQTGSWSVSSSSNKFNIDLGPKDNTNKPLGELTDDWKILSVSSTVIKLTDDNSSSNEFLTFTKN